jgi:hypothetical protein
VADRPTIRDACRNISRERASEFIIHCCGPCPAASPIIAEMAARSCCPIVREICPSYPNCRASAMNMSMQTSNMTRSSISAFSVRSRSWSRKKVSGKSLRPFRPNDIATTARVKTSSSKQGPGLGRGEHCGPNSSTASVNQFWAVLMLTLALPLTSLSRW